MDWVYDEIKILHQVMIPIPRMVSELKGRGMLIKITSSTIDLIYEWGMIYHDAFK